MIQKILECSTSEKFINRAEKNNNKIDQSLLGSVVNKFFKFYEIKTLEDLILKNQKGIFSNKFCREQEKILSILHHEIFKAMETYQGTLDTKVMA